MTSSRKSLKIFEIFYFDGQNLAVRASRGHHSPNDIWYFAAKISLLLPVCIANCFKLNDELKINQMEKVIKC